MVPFEISCIYSALWSAENIKAIQPTETGNGIAQNGKQLSGFANHPLQPFHLIQCWQYHESSVIKITIK